MKNLKQVANAIVLTAVMLVGCQKETLDPIFNGPVLGNDSFKKGGTNPPEPITDTIYVSSISAIYSAYDVKVNTNNNNNDGWPQVNVQYKSEAVNVVVTNKAGNIIDGVLVTGDWSGCYSKTSSATSVSGSAILLSGVKNMPTGCTLTFQIASLNKSGCYYKPSLNVVNSVSKVYL